MGKMFQIAMSDMDKDITECDKTADQFIGLPVHIRPLVPLMSMRPDVNKYCLVPAYKLEAVEMPGESAQLSELPLAPGNAKSQSPSSPIREKRKGRAQTSTVATKKRKSYAE